MTQPFDLQGHRGARGLQLENTLPSFEAAFDLGVTSVETDLHLTRDGVAVLCHDPRLGDPPCPVSSLSLAELRRHRAGRAAAGCPLAADYAREHGLDPYAVPALADLFRFAAAYAGEPGRRAGKTDAQRRRVGRLVFDLELKRVPFDSEVVNDGYTGRAPALLEQRVVEAVREAGVVGRTRVRSFDHRCVRLLRQMESGLTGAVLVCGTAPAAPAEVARAAGAEWYCPSYDFLDEDLVQWAHAGGVRVLPWTVNDPDDWRRLLDWGVDGLTTDFPDRLAEVLRQRGIAF